MEEATGHRVSVSMPSLDDATDVDFQQSGSSTTETAANDSVFSSGRTPASEIALDSLAANEPCPDFLTDKCLKDDLLDDSLEEAIKSQESVDGLIDTSAEGLDESQGDEDPSIAIDQFIKKIADEQLSSKRIEEREEEETQEKEEPMAVETSLEEDQPIEETQEDKQQEDSNKSTDTDEDINKKSMEPELMEIEDQKTLEKVVAEAVGESDDDEDDDEHMPESIEEIQKEINKIPVKKLISKANSKSEKEEANNGICDMDEDIEEILGGVPDDDNILMEKEQKLPTAKDLADVAKNPSLIEQSKEELSKMDILICGECHTPFYFYQELTEHKKSKCSKVSPATPWKGGKEQPIWGYFLWKNKFLALNEDKKPKWSLYQSWCNLSQTDRNNWISAGLALQYSNKMANSKVMEMRPAKAAKQSYVQKITNPPPPPEFIDSNKENSSVFSIDSTGNIVKKGLTPARPVKLNDVRITPAAKIVPTSSTTESNSALRSGKIGAKKEEFVVEKIMAKRFNPRRKTWEYNIKWENFGHDSNTWEPMNNLSHCKKLLEQFEEQLKRMKEEKAKSTTVSPKSRGRPAKDNKINNSTGFNSPKISNIVGGVGEDYGTPGTNRPQRHCKQKALNQVRQWCGSNSDDEDDDDDSGVKRKYNMDDDSDDDFEDKRIKLENDTEDSDEAPPKQKIPLKKASAIGTPKLMKNGNRNQPQVVPSNILIPDAHGVVRINQKQLPSLKSGVYIMSKTAGIIKLDSSTSKMATSGGQTVVTVMPKVGQSQIKVVSKDGKKEGSGQALGTATPVKISQASIVKNSTPRSTPKLRQENKKVLSPNLQAKMFLKKIDELNLKKPAEEDSDDGLEPLPFPAPDEPIPPLEEEEKNDDFVLDPETGKIAGIEYVDKPVVIKKEPQIEPATTSELENIVKIAAADLSDEDFEGENDSDDSLLQIKEETSAKAAPKTDTMERTVVDTSTRGIRKIIKYTVTGPSATPTILNKNVAQSQAKPKPIVRPQALGPRPPQKVINQMVSLPRMNQQQPQIKTVFRQQVTDPPTRPGATMVRKSVAAAPGGQLNRPRGSLGSKPLPSPLPPMRTYSAAGGIRQANRAQVEGNKGVAVRRVGNAIVRASPSGNAVRQQSPQQQQILTPRPPVTRIVQRTVSPQKKPAAAAQQQQQVVTTTVKQIQSKPPPTTTPVKSKTIINMPSLMEEDSPLSPPPKPQPKPTPQQRAPAKPAATAQPARLAPAQPKPLPTLAPLVKQEPVLKIEEAPADETSQPEAAEAAAPEQEDWSGFTMNEGEDPIFVTGDDGTLYQVAGQNEEGQTILLTRGPDGQQQCLLVSNEIGEMMGEEEPQPSTSTANVAAEAEAAAAAAIEEALTVDTTNLQLEMKADNAEGVEAMNDQVVAQVVQAEPLSPGGTHKVIVMLPDGTFMLTKVTPEEYAKLEIGA